MFTCVTRSNAVKIEYFKFISGRDNTIQPNIYQINNTIQPNIVRSTAFTAYATNNMVHQHHLVQEHEQPPLQPVAPSSCSFCSITINPINNRIPDRIKQHKYSPGSLVMVRLNNLSLKHKSHQVNIVELLGIFPASQIKVQTQSLIS